MNVVVIPNYSRPEMLTLMLEQIEKAVYFRDLYYLFSIDYGGDVNNITRIANDFIKRNNTNAEVILVPKTEYTTTKLSYAIVYAYRKAVELKPEYIFLLEDDIIIANNFFHWHYLVQGFDDVFCSIGTRNHALMQPLTKLYAKAFVYHTYQSHGVCWKTTVLQPLLELFTDNYFAHPHTYIARLFPNSKISNQFVEQAGMFNRMVEYNKYNVIYPYYPVAYHAGFYGKNRGKKPTGILEDNIKYLHKIIFHPQQMKLRIKQQRQSEYNINDSVPIDLIQPLVEKVFLYDI